MNEHPREGGHGRCSTYRLVHRPLGGTRGLPNLCSAHPSGRKDVRLISLGSPFTENHTCPLGSLFWSQSHQVPHPYPACL